MARPARHFGVIIPQGNVAYNRYFRTERTRRAYTVLKPNFKSSQGGNIMADRVMPGPVDDAACIREAVCIHTRKIFDSCRE